MDRPQIRGDCVGFIFAEFYFRHIGMARQNPTLDLPGKLVEIDTAAERPKRRRQSISALVGIPNRMAARAERRATRRARRSFAGIRFLERRYHHVYSIGVLTLRVMLDILVYGVEAGHVGDLTGFFWTKRFVRNCLGKEFCHAEEKV